MTEARPDAARPPAQPGGRRRRGAAAARGSAHRRARGAARALRDEQPRRDHAGLPGWFGLGWFGWLVGWLVRWLIP